MKVDMYCVALAVILLFLIYLDNSRNIENYGGMEGAPLDHTDHKHQVKHEHILDDQRMEDEPIGQQPVKVAMAPTESMGGSLEELQGAPVGDDYMLLSANMVPGIQTIDSNVPVAHPRVGGVGNLGKDGSHMMHDSATGSDTGSATGSVGSGSGSGSVKVVVIYAPWCGWSKKSLPDFEQMRETLDGVSKQETNGWDVSFEMYNSEDATGKQKVKEYEVEGFPSVLVEVNGQRKEGPRDYGEMMKMINSITGGNIQG
jgi:thiol-disulfide isomerase/thioredoxin